MTQQRIVMRRLWNGMIRRCHNPKDKGYKNYGGRGISVCERWRSSFDSFNSDMGVRPNGLSIDRINNDGNYEPGNCRWATHNQQRQNSRQAKLTAEAVRHIRSTVGSSKLLAAQYGVSAKYIVELRRYKKNSWPNVYSEQEVLMKVGDTVTWKSQAKGNWTVKCGGIVEVVPANKYPKTPVRGTFSRSRGWLVLTRDHESYVVKVGARHYWPVVSNLTTKLAAEAVSPTQLTESETLKLCAEFCVCCKEPETQPVGSHIRTCPYPAIVKLLQNARRAEPVSVPDLWIPCSQGLPIPEKIVWVWDKGWGACFTAERNESGTWLSCDGHEEPIDITHWMTLPDPPLAPHTKEGQ